MDFLEDLEVPAYKIASPEIFDIQLIKKIASTGKPVLLSTGLAVLEDIELALDHLRDGGCDKIVLLKCSTAYPAPFEEINLLTMTDYEKKFNVIPGISDHTEGSALPIASVALGAKVIEKHYVFEGDETVDSFFLLIQNNLKIWLVISEILKKLGSISYDLTSSVEKIIGQEDLYMFQKILKKESN